MGIHLHQAVFSNTVRMHSVHCYAIRAGWNLPDKKFRYLRTIIVTDLVYWSFDQELALPHASFQHRAGVTLYTSILDTGVMAGF